jgi:hypothetical protein
MIISSCGGGNSVSKKTFSIDAILSEEHPISNDERNIATRICYAYQSKSNVFRASNFIGTGFLFSGKQTDCQNNISNYQINSTLRYNENNVLIYAPPANFDSTLNFNKSVQTDTAGFLAQICPKIVRNEPISNTTTMTNIKVQITFIREGLDGFILQYFKLQPDGRTFKIDSQDKFKTRTQIDFTNGQIMGTDEYYSTQKVCASSLDKNRSSDFEQIFISHN